MSWIADNGLTVFSLLFGSGGLGYAIVTNVMNRNKNRAETKGLEADADVKGDAFWKARYDVLSAEKEQNDSWWKERYNNLKADYDKERQENNDMLTSFRTELNNLRTDYEARQAADRKAYDDLFAKYRELQEKSDAQASESLKRIAELERQIQQFEKR